MTGGPGGLCKHPPLLIQGEMVECVNSITFLELHNTSDLTQSLNTSFLVRKTKTPVWHSPGQKRLGPGGENCPADCRGTANRPQFSLRWQTAEEGQSCCPHSPGIRTVHTAAIQETVQTHKDSTTRLRDSFQLSESCESFPPTCPLALLPCRHSHIDSWTHTLTFSHCTLKTAKDFCIYLLNLIYLSFCIFFITERSTMFLIMFQQHN